MNEIPKHNTMNVKISKYHLLQFSANGCSAIHYNCNMQIIAIQTEMQFRWIWMRAWFFLHEVAGMRRLFLKNLLGNLFMEATFFMKVIA